MDTILAPCFQNTLLPDLFFISYRIMLFLTPGPGSWSVGCNFGVIYSYNCFTSSTIGNLEAPEPGHQPEEEEAQEQQMHAAPPPSPHSRPTPQGIQQQQQADTGAEAPTR